jgi:serine O-acetyltransferase
MIIFGIEVTPKCKIGKGLYIPHTYGTVIGASEIGEYVTIFQGVTIGAKFADIDFTINSRPKIGDRVLIGAGAKILGNISIGDDSIVSSNSLVINSVPNGVTVIGVPASIKI